MPIFWSTESPEAGLREIMRKKPEYWIHETFVFVFLAIDKRSGFV